MNINIKVLEVSKPEWKAKGKSKWQEVVVKFDSDKGEQSRKIQSFNKEIYEQVTGMKAGRYYDVEIRKEGDFWNWVSVEEGKAPESASTPSRGSYQASADRVPDRERQEMIIRQSCIGYAISFLGNHSKDGPVGTDDVLNIASIFENWVHTGIIPEAEEVDADDEALKQVEDAGEDAPPARRTRRTAEVD